MAMGSKCPYCWNQTLHIEDTGSFSECSSCGFVGWRVGAPVHPGPGKGLRCVNCQKATLHFLTRVADTTTEVYRCSTCLYAGVVEIKSKENRDEPR